MKSKKTLVLKIFFMILCMFIVFGSVCEGQQAHVSVKDVTVQLIKTRPPVGGMIIREYEIRAILCNTGDISSVNITVQFKDPELGINENLTLQPKSYPLQPNEEKTFVFENWPTALSGNVILNISYEPSSPNIVHTAYNSGHYLYTIQIGNTETTPSTPGFEILFVIIALFIILLKKQTKIP